VIYQHLSEGRRHTADCGDRCAAGCDIRAFEEALAAPVLPSDIRAEREREQQLRRIAAIANGEDPGGPV
jgi:hypothetical protein